MEYILIIISCIVTFFFPMLSLIINAFNCIIVKKKKKIFAIFVALSLATVAYVWKPSSIYDLYKWHSEVKMFNNYNLNDLINHITINYEPMNYIIKYLCSKIGNINMLQSIVCFAGYYIILWIISDYTTQNKCNNFSFTIVSIFAILSVGYINFISGLWFNLAIITFALGIYLNYAKNTKWLHWVFYILSISIHISTVYILLILITSRILKVKKNFKIIIIISYFASLFIGPVLTFLNLNINISIIHYIYKLYVSYFINGSQFSNLHTGINLYEAIIKLLICVLFICNSKDKIKEYNKEYLLFLAILIPSILALVFEAKIIIVRYSFFVVLILIPLLLDYFTKEKNKKIICVTCGLLMFFNILAYRQFQAIEKAQLDKCIDNNMTRNILQLENGVE